MTDISAIGPKELNSVNRCLIGGLHFLLERGTGIWRAIGKPGNGNWDGNENGKWECVTT